MPLDPALFLPEPVPEPQFATVISVDDHVVEPRDLFIGRIPDALVPRAPKIVETDAGHEVWEFNGERYTQVGMNAVAGRRKDTYSLEPFRFDQMRPGCFDPTARVADMDLGGIWASVNFPSQISGFCGRVFFNAEPTIGDACIRAFNDWIFDEWMAPHPTRFIGLSIAYLQDPELAVAEIRRNAARGFATVALPERPHEVGLPSLWDKEHWTPIIEACVETDTVVSLHVGSSGMAPNPPGGPALQLGATLFGQLSLQSCAEWLWSDYPLNYPTLKIAMSEGGIGWVAMLIDRLENLVDRSGYGDIWPMRPAEVLRRNFSFCTLDDPSTINTRHTIGIDNIMVEVDYPHGDSTWPHTQSVLQRAWGHLPPDEIRKLCCENAARLFRHPLPEVIAP